MPKSTSESPALAPQAFQASSPASACSWVAPAICSSADTGDRYNTMNLAMSPPSPGDDCPIFAHPAAFVRGAPLPQ